MASEANFQIVMISAGWENGGNTLHRRLDGHSELFVYPFESQLGNGIFTDYLSSLFHFKYRYPEFPIAGDDEANYELFYDEEMKTRLRTPHVSKFKNADIRLTEAARKKRFIELLEGKRRTRANIVAAFFQSTFDTWENFNGSGNEHTYVGYSPGIGIDADRILADFPGAHVVHIIRNPFSSYADTKHRPYPHPLHRYTLTWNILQHLAFTYAQLYPDRFHILRYEDLIDDPNTHLTELCRKLGLSFSDTLLSPSWNGRALDEVYPWGTIKKITREANIAAVDELSAEERATIRSLSSLMLKTVGYDDL